MHVLFAVQHLGFALTNMVMCGLTDLTCITVQEFASPAVDSALVLVPAAIAVSSIHKLMEHRESAMGLVVDLIVKGGASVGVILLFKAVSGF